jgi:hypothetical protein
LYTSTPALLQKARFRHFNHPADGDDTLGITKSTKSSDPNWQTEIEAGKPSFVEVVE